MKIRVRDFTNSETSKRESYTRFDVFSGTGEPESVQTGRPGDIYINLNGGTNNTIWKKESGFDTNTGWTAVGTNGWVDEEIFTSTSSQTEFTISNFTFDANSQLTVLLNGVDQDEGAGLDWTRNVPQQKIIFNTGLTENSRVKVKIW